ncbi:DNA ligase D [Chitinophaga oryziterrae]|uniref:DNA ligase (ATP) n=1 Tax=Chitinophaga oryziterrae TaxID=1031224 RepID=A0A6N8J7Y5_9BACT|nr:DNA ligase D [Chitinophaga oryziterrae]MVT40329.1 DNA ligase D [Chitinophaga oryziterrae]
MTLAKYKQKRSFSETPEPKGGKSKDNDLRFVVQKHHASHLHYDFRLEMKGVLKSWAVPKGPSTDPSVKRLAMMVEDHPYDYRNFEGTIPEGNYGAGTVIVWDEGTYTSADVISDDKKVQEKELLQQLSEGKLKFTLYGKKLKGTWALVKASGRGENSWLLMKLKDKYASTEDITKKDKSVVSGKTVEEVAATSGNVWMSGKKAAVSKAAMKAAASKKAVVSATKAVRGKKALKAPSDDIEDADDPAPPVNDLLKKGKRAKMPEAVKPMLATLTDKPFDNDDWIYEIKWDGYRAISYLSNGKVNLLSRKLISFNTKFPVIVDALKDWKVNAVVDGEIVAINDTGNPDFQALQNYVKNGKQARLVYYVFDLLWYDGKDYTDLPLTERKQILQNILPEDSEVIHFSDHITGKGTDFFHAATDKGLEGVMAKRADSTYAIDTRSQSWLKIKNNQKMEAIICGYTQGRNSRKHFGALILGKYKGSTLTYIGHTGGGFNEQSLKDLYDRFQDLITDESPFKKTPKTNMPVTWLRPALVCEVKFAEVTSDGILRQPIFLGLREDKQAANEKNEKVVKAPKNKSAGSVNAKKKATPESKKQTAKAESKLAKKVAMKAPAKKSGSSSSEKLLSEDQKEITLTINSKQLKFTNLDKIYWPKEKITKRDMLNYYANIAEFILPYLKDRPQSLNRYPNGIDGLSFYQKDVEGKVADWVETFSYVSESDGETKHFLVCKDEASLLYMANLGCIEMHPWHSRVQKPDNPDWCVIDLDPDQNPFDQVIETALVIKDVLDSAGATSYVKTSGSTGMHILLPLGAKYSYDQSRMLAELIVGIVNKQLPKTTSVERSPAKRKGLIYLDFLQNRQIQTIAAPYSLRPKPGATASAPLDWSEVKKGLKMSDFNIFNMRDRITETGDILKGVLGKGIDLNKILPKVQGLL